MRKIKLELENFGSFHCFKQPFNWYFTFFVFYYFDYNALESDLKLNYNYVDYSDEGESFSLNFATSLDKSMKYSLIVLGSRVQFNVYLGENGNNRCESVIITCLTSSLVDPIPFIFMQFLAESL